MKNTLSKIPKSVRVYPIVNLFFYLSVGLLAPIQILFYRQIGLSLFQIGLLSTILEATIFIFEVPTGIMADKFGRKPSIMGAFTSFVICGLIFMLSKNVDSLMLATFFQGVGFTMLSGAFQAWAVDKLIEINKKDFIDELIIWVTKAQKAGYLVGSILGGYIGIRAMSGIWIAYVAINSICLLMVIMFMSKPELRKATKDKAASGDSEEGEHRSVFAINNKVIIKFIVILGVISLLHEFSFSPVDEYWTVYFNENLKLNSAFLGWIIAFSNIAIIILITPCTNFLKKKLGQINMMTALMGFAAINIVLLITFRNPVIAILFLLLFRFAVGVYSPVYDSYINSLIKGKYRATILSANDMLGSLGEIISGVTVGAIAESLNIKISFLFSVAGFLLIVLLFRVVNKMRSEEV